jgi:hypothetical protein
MSLLPTVSGRRGSVLTVMPHDKPGAMLAAWRATWPRKSCRVSVAVAWDDMSADDYDGNGAARVDQACRPDPEMADRAWWVGLDANECLRWVIEQPAPEVEVLQVTGKQDLLTTPLLETRLQQSIEKGRGHLVVGLRGVTFSRRPGCRA